MLFIDQYITIDFFRMGWSIIEKVVLVTGKFWNVHLYNM